MSDLWWRITKMKKEAKSRAAKEHRRKYETAYESTPARKKYRRELERERRKRGVAGKGGKDMSHTKEGTIVPEDPHTNRARSHPSVGSTLKMVVVKAPLYDITTGKQVAGKPTPMPDLKETGYEYRFDHASNPYEGTPMTDLLYVSPDQSTRAKVMLPHNQFGGKPRATIPLMGVHRDKRGQGKGREALRNLKDELREVAPEVKKPPRPLGVGGMDAIRFWSQMDNEGLASYRLEDDDYDEDMERLYNDMVQQGEPMDIAMQLLKEQKKLFVQGQMTLDGRPAFTPTDFAAEERRRQAALKEAKAKEQRMIAVQQHEAMTNEERMARTEADRLKEKQAREAQQRRAAMGNATLPLRNPE